MVPILQEVLNLQLLRIRELIIFLRGFNLNVKSVI